MIIVIAGSFAETAAFARQQGMRNVSHVVNRDKIKGLRPTTVHLLPGYWKRRDIHAINVELANFKRMRPPAEFVEWVKNAGVLVRTDEVSGSDEEPWTPEIPDGENALESSPTEKIAETQAAQVSALTQIADLEAAGRVDVLQAMSDELEEEPADDIDDFWSMIDSAEES